MNVNHHDYDFMKRLPNYHIIWYNFFNNNDNNKIYTNCDDKNRLFYSLKIQGTTLLFLSE